MIQKLFQLPYSRREAEEKFELLLGQLDEKWIGDQSVLRKQLDTITKLLQLGAYALPMKVLSSDKVDRFYHDAIKKDLFRCYNDIRRGRL